MSVREDKRSVKQIARDKEQRLMETIAWRAGYYRANPHRFAEEVLGIKLKLFQKILIWVMMMYNYCMYLAARGQGKTFLVALFCCIRCILYPGTKIVVCSATIKQATEVLLKIQDDFMKRSPFLCNEIEKCNIGQNDATIMFKCGSWIKVRTSTENARSARANLLIVDEFRMVDENIINMVLRKFLTSPRQPKYLEKPEYKHLLERNKEIYLSSAWWKSSWAYKKAQGYTLNFFDDKKKYFICGLPYQVSIYEGLLSREQLIDEMSEPDWNDIMQAMEIECLWIGDDGDNLFKYEEIQKRRKIKNAFMPLKFYTERNQVPKVGDAAERVLSVDVALMATTKKKKNDASAISINDLIHTDTTSYQSNFVYMDTFEGLTTDELGLIVMRYFYHYRCTQLVLDTAGVGMGVFDFICKDQYDPETGDTYKALTCCNNDDMAMRCKVKDANRVVWCVKADANFNNNICVSLRNGIQNGKISFLISDTEAENVIRANIRNYDKLSSNDQILLKKPYIQTTMAEYELIKLDSEIRDGKIKVKEISGMRKDRYSSLAYSYWCANQLELKLRPYGETTNDLITKLLSCAQKSSFTRK